MSAAGWLDQRDDVLLHVGGTGRQVDDQVVERTPGDVVRELVEDEVGGLSRQREGLVLAKEEAG